MSFKIQHMFQRGIVACWLQITWRRFDPLILKIYFRRFYRFLMRGVETLLTEVVETCDHLWSGDIIRFGAKARRFKFAKSCAFWAAYFPISESLFCVFKVGIVFYASFSLLVFASRNLFVVQWPIIRENMTKWCRLTTSQDGRFSHFKICCSTMSHIRKKTMKNTADAAP